MKDVDKSFLQDNIGKSYDENRKVMKSGLMMGVNPNAKREENEVIDWIQKKIEQKGE